ncbi:MAG: SIS domain-containing protein, partial [Alphaproteobacteria bacterium]|nr:SIS domain-containing protein [Alphaproteobacteria bacterium]
RAGNKILFCGNGGSACDAMHIAGEFVGRFVKERKGLPAIALSADSGILTAVGNDYGFEQIFARQVEALARKGDIVIALSTSGKSPNILTALEAARNAACFTVLMTGEKGVAQKDKADLLLAVPHTETARIQEAHLLALHTLAGMAEQALID